MIIMGLITNSGEAKSYAMESLAFAREKNYEAAAEAIEEANAKLKLAHKSQTELIQNEAKGNTVETSILLIHAQDHLMNAITVRDLASEMIEMYKQIHEGK